MMFEARDITVRYGSRVALSGVTIRARAGQITAIVGPNGSGKSTLLAAMTGTVAHDGQVLINGRNVAGQAPWALAAQRAVLPQQAQLAFPFHVIEVVRMGLQAGRCAANADIPLQALARVGLSHYAEHSFHALSGGEAQRVMLARVLAQVWQPVDQGAPRWLLLDEPVASLDIAHQLQVMGIARDFARAGGGVIAVMHDLNLTALYADQVAVLARGRLLAQGTPGAVMTDAIMSRAYGCTLRVSAPPPRDTPYILPHAASA